HEADAVGLAEIAAVLGEDRADLAGGAVAVVGQRLDDHGHAARTVALVAHLVVVGVGVAARAALDRAIDRVARHVRFARGDHGSTKARIGVRISRAEARRGRDLADQLGEDLGPLGVLTPFAVHDILELRMASHRPKTRFSELMGRLYHFSWALGVLE